MTRTTSVQSARSFTPKEVLLSPVIWLLYVMFIMVSASGLIASAEIAVIASDLNVGNSVVFFGATTLTVALTIDNLANGAARPLFGWTRITSAVSLRWRSHSEWVALLIGCWAHLARRRVREQPALILTGTRASGAITIRLPVLSDAGRQEVDRNQVSDAVAAKRARPTSSLLNCERPWPKRRSGMTGMRCKRWRLAVVNV